MVFIVVVVVVVVVLGYSSGNIIFYWNYSISVLPHVPLCRLLFVAVVTHDVYTVCIHNVCVSVCTHWVYTVCYHLEQSLLNQGMSMQYPLVSNCIYLCIRLTLNHQLPSK